MATLSFDAKVNQEDTGSNTESGVNIILAEYEPRGMPIIRLKSGASTVIDLFGFGENSLKSVRTLRVVCGWGHAAAPATEATSDWPANLTIEIRNSGGTKLMKSDEYWSGAAFLSRGSETPTAADGGLSIQNKPATGPAYSLHVYEWGGNTSVTQAFASDPPWSVGDTIEIVIDGTGFDGYEFISPHEYEDFDFIAPAETSNWDENYIVKYNGIAYRGENAGSYSPVSGDTVADVYAKLDAACTAIPMRFLAPREIDFSTSGTALDDSIILTSTPVSEDRDIVYVNEFATATTKTGATPDDAYLTIDDVPTQAHGTMVIVQAGTTLNGTRVTTDTYLMVDTSGDIVVASSGGSGTINHFHNGLPFDEDGKLVTVSGS